jgi:photosynthetic reaction center H subunit
MTYEGELRIVPLRDAAGWEVAHQDPDPRGMPVYGADDQVGGTVIDVWVDRSDIIFRYLEVEVQGASGKRNVLVPMTFARVGNYRVRVRSILSTHFADVPGTRLPDRVTRLEEDRICAYYGAGTLYALPSRQEPLL